MLNISEEIVTGVLDRWVATQVNWEKFSRIEILGIDEIALKRGHRDYVVLVTTPVMELFVLGVDEHAKANSLSSRAFWSR